MGAAVAIKCRDIPDNNLPVVRARMEAAAAGGGVVLAEARGAGPFGHEPRAILLVLHHVERGLVVFLLVEQVDERHHDRRRTAPVARSPRAAAVDRGVGAAAEALGFGGELADSALHIEHAGLYNERAMPRHTTAHTTYTHHEYTTRTRRTAWRRCSMGECREADN